MRSRSVSLSRYLAGNVLIFLAPLLLASGLSLWTINLQARRSFVDLSSLSSSLVSSRFEEFFARPQEAAVHIATLLARPELYPRARLEAYLSGALEGFPYIDRLQVVGADDRVEAVVPPDPGLIGVSRAGEQVYEEVRGARSLVWSESYISTRNNRPALTFGLKAGAETILCDLNLEWVGEYASALSVWSAPGVEVRITDANGVFLSAIDPDLVSRRERMPDFTRLKQDAGRRVVDALRAEGSEWLVSAARISDPNWYVFVLYPASGFSDSLLKGYVELLLLFAAVGAAGLVFWRLRFRRVSGALAAISVEAGRISRGDYSRLGDFGGGFAEFSRVGESLDGMVAAIGRREQVLLDRERSFRETLERIDLVAVGVDAEGIIRFVNPFMLSLSGYSREEMEGRPVNAFVVPGPGGCPFARLLAGEAVLPLERCTLRTREGSLRLVDWSIVRNLDGEGRSAGAMGIGHDVTELVRQQELVAASLREKEVLLREVHHRVKNNLQIILSLLHLQELEAKDPGVRRSLELSANRILSIALVHETIYASEDFTDLEFGSYAHALVSQLLSLPEGRSPRLVSDLEPLRLDLLDAVPCGLVLNEALRFLLERIPSGTEKGRATVELLVRGGAEGRVRLACRSARLAGAGGEADDGLMRVLAEQLRGGLEIREEQGLEVLLAFPLRPSSTKS